LLTRLLLLLAAGRNVFSILTGLLFTFALLRSFTFTDICAGLCIGDRLIRRLTLTLLPLRIRCRLAIGWSAIFAWLGALLIRRLPLRALLTLLSGFALWIGLTTFCGLTLPPVAI